MTKPKWPKDFEGEWAGIADSITIAIDDVDRAHREIKGHLINLESHVIWLLRRWISAEKRYERERGRRVVSLYKNRRLKGM